ncbi:hypothetical protein HK101_001568, partial [Irineochytrium annulatum]
RPVVRDGAGVLPGHRAQICGLSLVPSKAGHESSARVLNAQDSKRMEPTTPSFPSDPPRHYARRRRRPPVMNFPIISLTVDRGLYAYAVDSSEQLWQTSLQTATDPRSWVQIEAVTPSVTIAGSTLYGVTVDRNIASRSSPVTDPTNPAPWQSFLVTPFHNITHVAGNDAGELWFLDSGLGVYRANRLTGTATRDSGVVASQIVVGNDAVYAVSSDKGLCARQFDVPGWACQPIPATQVAVSATHVFIVDQAHYLYESPLPFNETLPFVRTAMTQIGAFTADVSSGALWADDGQGGIFRASVDSGSRAGPGVGRAKKFEVGSLFAGIKRASQYSEAPPMYDSSKAAVGKVDPRRVADALVVAGVAEVWRDVSAMAVGDALFETLARAILDADVVVAFISDEYAASVNCRREFAFSSMHGKPILPVICGVPSSQEWRRSGIAFQLADVLYVDMSRVRTAEEEQEKLGQLMSAIKERDPGQKISVHVKTLRGKILTVSTTQRATIKSLKEAINLKDGYPIDEHCMYFAGKLLASGILTDYKITDNSTIHLLLRGGGEVSPPTLAAPAYQTSAAAPAPTHANWPTYVASSVVAAVTCQDQQHQHLLLSNASSYQPSNNYGHPNVQCQLPSQNQHSISANLPYPTPKHPLAAPAVTATPPYSAQTSSTAEKARMYMLAAVRTLQRRSGPAAFADASARLLLAGGAAVDDVLLGLVYRTTLPLKFVACFDRVPDLQPFLAENRPNPWEAPGTEQDFLTYIRRWDAVAFSLDVSEAYLALMEAMGACQSMSWSELLEAYVDSLN